jgi:hypothetical protein
LTWVVFMDTEKDSLHMEGGMGWGSVVGSGGEGTADVCGAIRSCRCSNAATVCV